MDGMDRQKFDADRMVRERLVGVAMPMFLNDGYIASTSEAVARAAGVSKKTLYRLFPSKEHLLATCVASVTAAISRDLAAVYAGPGDLRERIETAITIVSREYGRIRSPRFLDEARTVAPAVWTAFTTWRSQELARFADLLMLGISERIVRDRYTIDDIGRSYTSMIFACMELLHRIPSSVEPGVVYHTFIDLFFHGLMDPAYTTPPIQLVGIEPRPWVR